MTAMAILPAAGRGSRFGAEPKLAQPIAGVPLLERTIRSLLAGGVDEAIVVLAAESPIAVLEVLRDRRVRTAINPDPSRGMLSSIQEGMRSMAAGADCVLILPADMPFVRAETVGAVLAACTAGGRIVSPVHAGRRGHPIGIPPTAIGAVLAADPTATLSQVLERSGVPRVEIVLDDPGILRDVDVPGDL